jgi:hypothetical protein
MRRILKPVTYVLAAIYLFADMLFAGIARPISQWIARRVEMPRLRAWIGSLPPYPCLALFSVPVILLEPVKFVAAYIAATGSLLAALFTFITGELLKLVLIERLFDMTREKLLRIPAFAWSYDQYMRLRIWIMQSEAWQAIRSAGRYVLKRVRSWRVLTDRRRLAWDRGD